MEEYLIGVKERFYIAVIKDTSSLVVVIQGNADTRQKHMILEHGLVLRHSVYYHVRKFNDL